MSKLRHKKANNVGPWFAHKYLIKFSRTTTQAYFWQLWDVSWNVLRLKVILSLSHFQPSLKLAGKAGAEVGPLVGLPPRLVSKSPWKRQTFELNYNRKKFYVTNKLERMSFCSFYLLTCPRWRRYVLWRSTPGEIGLKLQQLILH